jgi:hypothetical protein
MSIFYKRRKSDTVLFAQGKIGVNINTAAIGVAKSKMGEIEIV